MPLITDSLQLQEIDVNVFTSLPGILEKPKNARGVFGGQVIAQAVLAATKRAPEGFVLHSLHSYFLAAASSSLPLIFFTDLLRQGRSYATFSVYATQKGVKIFYLICSFKSTEDGALSFQMKLPETVPRPSDCVLREDRLQTFLDQSHSWPSAVRVTLQNVVNERRDSAIAIMDAPLPESMRPQRAFWLKVKGIEVGALDRGMQKAVLAYLSDFLFIGTAHRPLGITNSLEPGKGKYELGMNVSLDHTIWFYDNDFDTCNWLLHLMEPIVGGDGRATVHGKIFTEHGKLVAVTTQEGVVRPKRPAGSSKL
ncbi:Acyl-CoA thioesterase [Phaffia rhodozyma]|uniref:Acyl-CoA thioesterase n=1 Tax=Phaffia rhodozyma TaxID=264483 RepID=A0A0F7SQ21_PHARH|nr:Acyl-CoA thioesterase [Phaffia rhodozyma]